ncbi:hypothetical protein BRAS3843_370023 [Bradyrhizobium sp. STM 3843]|nr:hypothetical protein BRAS3843_370023 [Bradyrhizobium sp. STM 3843]
MSRQSQPVEDAADHLPIGERLAARHGVDLVGCCRRSRRGDRADREILGVDRLPRPLSAANQRHHVEATDQPRQGRDIPVASFAVDQRRAEDGPGDVVLFADGHDLALGFDQVAKAGTLGRDLAVQLGEEAGRAQDDQAFQLAGNKMNERRSEQRRMRRAVQRRKCREPQRLLMLQITRDRVHISPWGLGTGQDERALAAPDKVVEQIAADQAGAADHQASWLLDVSVHRYSPGLQPG